MGPDGPEVRYARDPSALWRDAGACVLTLLPEPQAGVVQLAGGSAVLWRLLDQPRTVAELVAAVDTPDGEHPGAPLDREGFAAAVKAAADQLVTHGLVRRMAGAA
jgi:hypothetical protein